MKITDMQKLDLMDLCEEISERNIHIDLNFSINKINYWIFWKDESKEFALTDISSEYFDNINKCIESLRFDLARLPMNGNYHKEMINIW